MLSLTKKMFMLSEISFELITPYVPWVIGGLVVWGLICQCSAWLSYNEEIRYTLRLNHRIRDLLHQPQDNVISAEELLEEEQIPESSMVATRTIELETFAQYPGMVALHDLGSTAAEVDSGRLRNAIPSVLIASLLVCGLLGTLMSLKETLPKVNISKERLENMNNNPGGGTAEYAENLQKVTEGFGDAFLASIFGVGGTLVLIVGRIFVRDKRERSFSGIEKFVVDRLLPYYVKPEKTQLQRASTALAEAHAKFLEVNRQMNDSSESIQKALEKLDSAIRQADITFGSSGPVVIGLKGFTSATKKFNDNAEALVNTQKISAEVLGELSLKNKELITKIDRKSDEDKENQTNLLSQMASLMEGLMRHSTKIQNAVVSSVNELKQSQHSVTKAIENGSSANIENGEKLEQALSNSFKGFIADLKRHNDELSVKLGNLYKENVGTASKANEHLTNSLAILSGQLEKIVLREDRIDVDAFNEFRNHLAAMDGKLENILKSNLKSLEETRGNHIIMDQKLHSSLDIFSERIKTLSKIIDKIADAGSIEHDNMASKFVNLFRNNRKP